MEKTIVDGLSLDEFKIIELAYRELHCKNLNEKEYSVTAFYRDEKVIVIFSDGVHQKGERGNIGNNPAFEVVVDPKTMEVVSISFAR